MQLMQAGLTVACVDLPLGHDPNSYFCSGHSAADFGECLERAYDLSIEA
jgi:hypothetical protein